MSTKSNLSRYFSNEEMSETLLEALYFKAVFEKPEVLREVLKDEGSANKIEEFIAAERLRLGLVYGAKMGALVGVAVPTEDPYPTMGNA